MTTYKSFKSASIFVLLIAALVAGPSAQARPQQLLVLPEGTKVKVACPQGLSPILQGEVVECGQTCKLEVVNQWNYLGCDQGGCFPQPRSYHVTLTRSKSEPVLFEGVFNFSFNKSEMIEKIKTEFADSCKSYQLSEKNQ